MTSLCLIVGASALVVALWLHLQLVRSLKELTTVLHRIGNADFQARMTTRMPSRYMRKLSTEVNDLALRLGKHFNEMRSNKEELRQLIASVPEGLLIIGKDERVIIHNEALCISLDCAKDITGRAYWEIVRIPIFSNLIKDVRAKKTSLFGEYAWNSKVYQVSASFLPAQESIAILLRDITEQHTLNTIKKEFATNVSHELRTPLTAIKGFIETLEDEVTGPAATYVKTIHRHTDRLINIVQDLLLLSELEQKAPKLSLEPVQLGTLVLELKTLFEHRLTEKKLTLSITEKENTSPLQGDRFKLEQVFVNLIDNAIKYSDQGTIAIHIEQIGTQIITTITDAGIGIADKDIARIFERFYVTDKSRSRQTGGTGLGLSIVKHIILWHNGDIKVSSQLGRGTTFTITLPINATTQLS